MQRTVMVDTKDVDYLQVVCEHLQGLFEKQNVSFAKIKNCTPEGLDDPRIPKNGVTVMSMCSGGSPHGETKVYIFQMGEYLAVNFFSVSCRYSAEYKVSENEPDGIARMIFNFLGRFGFR